MSAEQDPTISVGRTLGILRDGEVEISVANLDLEREFIAAPTNRNARIYPVRADLKRVKVTYTKKRPKILKTDLTKDDSDASKSDCTTTSGSPYSRIPSASDLSQIIPEPLCGCPTEVIPEKWPTRPEYDPERIDMSEDQQERLNDLFDEYTDIFSTSAGDIGRTHLTEHQIILEEGSGYFYETPR